MPESELEKYVVGGEIGGRKIADIVGRNTDFLICTVQTEDGLGVHWCSRDGYGFSDDQRKLLRAFSNRYDAVKQLFKGDRGQVEALAQALYQGLCASGSTAKEIFSDIDARIAEARTTPTYAWVLLAFFILIFASTGVLSLWIGNLPKSALAIAVHPFHNVVYGWHLAAWMILGMMANYLWDLFASRKGFVDVSLPALLIPILVSPIVFYAIWSLVQKTEGLANIDMVWPLIAFQNGFFWQVVFSKAAPK